MNFSLNTLCGKINLRFVLAMTLAGGVVSLAQGHPTGVTKSNQKKGTSASAKKTSPSSKANTKKTTASSAKKSSSASSKKGSSRSAKKKTPKIRGQQSLEPSRIMEIQSALAAAGHYKTNPTGQWDDQTSKALSTYQQENGFKVTGKPDALSLRKLGL